MSYFAHKAFSFCFLFVPTYPTTDALAFIRNIGSLFIVRAEFVFTHNVKW